VTHYKGLPAGHRFHEMNAHSHPHAPGPVGVLSNDRLVRLLPAGRLELTLCSPPFREVDALQKIVDVLRGPVRP
jgi:hypothetical protein